MNKLFEITKTILDAVFRGIKNILLGFLFLIAIGAFFKYLSGGEFIVSVLVILCTYAVLTSIQNHHIKYNMVTVVDVRTNAPVFSAYYQHLPRIGEYIFIPPDPNKTEIAWEVLGLSQTPHGFDGVEIYAKPVVINEKIREFNKSNSIITSA